MKFKEILKKTKRRIDIYKNYRNDRKQFSKHWIESKPQNHLKSGYSILLLVHSLEKGMTCHSPRCFGFEKIKKIHNLLSSYDKLAIDYAYKMGVNAIRAYIEFYKHNAWTDKEEYLYATSILDNYKDIDFLDVGSYVIEKKDFIHNSKIDYKSFLSSRHSIRNYKSQKITPEDFYKAVDMASLTPTACNRQMCKIYYINDETKRKLTLKHGNGLTNFQIDNVNIFLITYDISSFCFIGDRNQGWFNSGLVGMNFVNSLHSLGIGSCFIQFGNSYNNEKKLKQALDIPENEKISVMIAAGYYDEKSLITNSTRKSIFEISKII